MLALDMQSQFAAIDDDLDHRIVEGLICLGKAIDHFVEIAAVRTLGRQLDPRLALQSREPRRVTGTSHPEHARSLRWLRDVAGVLGQLLLAVLGLTHAPAPG